jgi:hypothetical protein
MHITASADDVLPAPDGDFSATTRWVTEASQAEARAGEKDTYQKEDEGTGGSTIPRRVAELNKAPRRDASVRT